MVPCLVNMKVLLAEKAVDNFWSLKDEDMPIKRNKIFGVMEDVKKENDEKL